MPNFIKNNGKVKGNYVKIKKKLFKVLNLVQFAFYLVGLLFVTISTKEFLEDLI